MGQAWIMAVLAGQGPMSHVHVPACLCAAAQLGVKLSGCQDSVRTLSGPQALSILVGAEAVRTAQPCQAVLARLSGLRHQLSHAGLALGLWGLVGSGCKPDRGWVDAWLLESQRLMCVVDDAAEINMLLQACVQLQHVPPTHWLHAVYGRLQQLLLIKEEQQQQQQLCSSSVGLSSSSIVATIKYLAALQKLHHQQQQRQQQQHESALGQEQQQQQQQKGLLPVPQPLLALMSARMEYLESHRWASPASVQHFHVIKAHLLGKQLPDS